MATNKVDPVVYQFRYYGSANENNYPDGNSWIGLTDNSSAPKNLLTGHGAAVKIGIQTLPGIKFSIGSSFSNSIIIDHTGVYELDLRNTTTTISNLSFDAASIARIDEIDNASIIVDVLCNPEDGTVNS